MKIYESGWIDLKKTIEYIARGTISEAWPVQP